MTLHRRLDRLEARLDDDSDADVGDPLWYEDGPEPLRRYLDAVVASVDPLVFDPADLLARHPMLEDIRHAVATLREFPEPLTLEKLQRLLFSRAIHRLADRLMAAAPEGETPLNFYAGKPWARREAFRLEAECRLFNVGPFVEQWEYFVRWIKPHETTFGSAEPYLTAWRSAPARDPAILDLAGIGPLEAELLGASA